MGPEPPVTQEGPPLPPLREGEIKIEDAGAMLVHEDDAMVGEMAAAIVGSATEAMAEEDSSCPA